MMLNGGSIIEDEGNVENKLEEIEDATFDEDDNLVTADDGFVSNAD